MMTSPPKVLFVAGGQAPDYQCDMLLHGLRSVLGRSLEETQPLWYMYDDLSQVQQASLYGRGFTIYGRLPREGRTLAPVSPLGDALTNLFQGSHTLTRRTRRHLLRNCRWATRLRRNVEQRRYDLVIFGSIHRCTDLLDTVLGAYPPDRIAFVDGEDETDLRRDLIGMGIYFKRELTSFAEGALPINFAIPQELIVPDVPIKLKDWATVVPGDPATYIFSSESSYYRDYQSSRFAITTKKAGWDCLRHYEILMNGCLPYFPTIRECPPATMTTFPKELIASVCSGHPESLRNLDDYSQIVRDLLDHTRCKLTTRAIAGYVLSQMDAPPIATQ